MTNDQAPMTIGAGLVHWSLGLGHWSFHRRWIVSQQEFDNYLALLARLLRIAPQQREQVAEEFRTHMEDRLDDLLSRGIGRDKAVKLALEEFGDAAALAAQIAHISANRKRRWYMKVSAFGVAGLAAAVLLAIALWPESQRLPATAQAVAQQPGMKGAKGKTKAATRPASLEEKLASRIQVDFLETPLSEIFAFLGETAKIQIYVNRRALTEESLALDAPVTMALKDVRVDTVLDLALEQVSDQLAYLERDGVLIISTVTALEGATEVQVYNCRDLLALTTPQPGMMMGMEGGMMGGGMPGMTPGGGLPPGSSEEGSGASSPPTGLPPAPAGGAPAVPAGPAPSPIGAEGADPFATPPPDSRSSTELWKSRAILAQAGGGMMGGMGGGPGMMPGGMMGGDLGGGPGGGMMGAGAPSRRQPTTDHERRAARLMNLITTAIDPGSWQETGGFGTISEYEGLIVVNHNARTHKKIENVLSMLRQSAGMPPAPMAGGMGGGMMGGGMMSGMGGGGFGGGFPGGGAGGGGGFGGGGFGPAGGGIPGVPDAGGGAPGVGPAGAGAAPAPR